MSTAERVVVDPVTRIEGHLRIEAQTDDAGRITQAYSAGTMVRGIEIILKGRDPRDAWAFTQRICGVCTLVHGMASIRAVEDALHRAVPDYRIPHNAGTLNVGDMLAFIQYATSMLFSFVMLSMAFIMYPRAAVSGRRIAEVLAIEPVINDPEYPKTNDCSLCGEITFENVYFRYPDAQEDVLRDISFTAKAGTTTAFIGSTGSGKSTIVNLIPRFYDVTAGSIKIDGIDIRDYKQTTLRDKIGYIPQKGVLFSGSIDSNIRYGTVNAKEEDVLEALEIAQAKEIVAEKAEGLEYLIAQGATNVSGGQKQRLSIARALAKKPEIYIFDDSFSALDYKTDALLRKAIKDKLADATVLIVGQRVSTIRHADQIIVLENGAIVGSGTHHQLLEECPVYLEIAASQLSKEELA